jgi:hypothetical protein
MYQSAIKRRSVADRLINSSIRGSRETPSDKRLGRLAPSCTSNDAFPSASDVSFESNYFEGPRLFNFLFLFL